MQHIDGEAEQEPAVELADTMRRTCLGTRVSQLHRIIARHYEHALRPLGLSLPHMEILSYLILRGDAVRPRELGEALHADGSTLSRNLAALQQRGWVRDAATSATGRSMTVAVTSAGTTAFAAAESAWSDAQAGLEQQLGPQAPAVLDAWLHAVA